MLLNSLTTEYEKKAFGFCLQFEILNKAEVVKGLRG